jgi:hypothetical protein
MRARTTKFQYVIVRPLKERVPDELGDTPIIASQNRTSSFRMKMKIIWSTGSFAEPGKPGKDENLSVQALVVNRDIPRNVSWSPNTNDIVETVSGKNLFITDVQPIFPIRRRLGNPDGGWDGYTLTLEDRQPTMSAATQYE